MEKEGLKKKGGAPVRIKKESRDRVSYFTTLERGNHLRGLAMKNKISVSELIEGALDKVYPLK